MRLTLTCACIVMLMCPATAQQLHNNQAVSVGPWTITTTYKGDKFDNCNMARTTPGLGVTFVRAPDGLLLVLESPSRCRSLPAVRGALLSAGSRCRGNFGRSTTS